ncbi:protein SEC17 [Kluyveromyces marxianus]|uniref:Protein SEC17 n=1 Tax=Kluyveromyces marxianus TaxID=4911 RepID=A0ABX6F2H5_KLUMA|nr:protein SEC17 [Kluyveromyces marxianus]
MILQVPVTGSFIVGNGAGIVL